MVTLTTTDQLVSDATSRVYQLLDDVPIGEGGFGVVYRGVEVGRGDGEVAVKVCHDLTTWHGEAYLGALFSHLKRLVGARDAFVEARDRRLAYLLISEWIDGGTVADLLEREEGAWSEQKVVRELKALLKDLAQVHAIGVTHRDIKPANVFVDRGRLRLGDFGIARQVLGRKGGTVLALTPPYSPPEHADGGRGINWEPRDDVYMLGLLALTLLRDEDTTNADVSRLDVVLRDLAVSDDLKYWLWHALGARELRFDHAGEALAGLSRGRPPTVRAPSSLQDQRVVFTGAAAGWGSRAEAAAAARAAGAVVQDKVNSETTLVVKGRLDPRTCIGTQAGSKLFDAWLRQERGQRIAVIDGKRLRTLTER